MRRLLAIILVFLVQDVFGQSFNVTSSVISLNIKQSISPVSKVRLTHAVKLKNEFYCFFRVDEKDSPAQDKKLCFIFSDASSKPRIIEVPEEIEQTNYFDLFVNDGKVFVKTYMHSKTFYFDNKLSKWVNAANAKDLIFEDEKYYVYSLDFEEWGGKTWFKDKKTGAEYLIEMRTPLVNKIGTTYYLTHPFAVVKIEDPVKLNKCASGVRYENIKRRAKFTSWYGKKIGFEIVYNDTTAKNHYYENVYRPHIVSSFVWGNELFHIYETSNATYISKITGSSMMPVQEIGRGFRFFAPFTSYRNKIQKDGQQLLKFENSEQTGFVEIDKQGIRVYNLILK